MPARSPMGLLARLDRARALLGDRPKVALAEAQALLRLAPQHVQVRLLLGAARRRSGDPPGALEILAPLGRAQPRSWGLQFEVGAAHAVLGEPHAAIAALERAVALNPQSPLAWHALGEQLAIVGDQAGAEAAHGKPLAGAIGDPALMTAVAKALDSPPGSALASLADRFNLHLSDPLTISLLADAGLRLRRFQAVEALLHARLALLPGFVALRQHYAVTLFHQHKFAQASAQLEIALTQDAQAAPPQILKAALLAKTGDYQAAIDIHEALLAKRPDQPRLWLSYGHVLKTLGRQGDAVDAYRRSLTIEPRLGEAYWSLANLKVVAFQAADIGIMRALAVRDDLSGDDLVHLHFALGKALEDAGAFAESCEYYRSGNALRRASAPHDAQANRDYVRRTVATFTPSFFDARAGTGDRSDAPIFIVGLPRSGSTLVEQILASHSSVEGLSELSELTDIAAGTVRDRASYPSSLAALDGAALAGLGQAYLVRAGAYRKTGCPRFTDKFPGNFMHAGLIHLILPNARIIDVRRHPVGCCFSAFKQHFAQGQHYSYDLGDLGRYYADYVELMAHFDRLLPGRVYRLAYEDLIENPEAEVRRLLDHCALPFEAACLQPHRSDRPVRTASSEQVRRPIFGHAVDHWRNFEPWLGDLTAALWPVVG